MDRTRHMIIFDVLSWKSPRVGEKGERLRLFLSDVGMPRRRHLRGAEKSKSANTPP